MFFQASIITFYSCSTSKKTIKDDVQIVKADDKTTKEDDLKKEENKDKEIKDPIEPSKDKDEGVKKDGVLIDGTKPKTYETRKITVLLPSISDDNRYLQFYAGLKIAAEELEIEGLNLEVEVLDTKESTDLSFIDFTSTDLIFAPNNENQIKKLIEITKGKKTKVVSSWFSLSNVEKSPHYLQLKPSLRSHFRTIVEDINSRFSIKDAVILVRNTKSDLAWLKYFQTYAKNILGTSDAIPIAEYIVSEDSITSGKSVFTNLIYSKGKKIFILPNYSYKDENYINGVLRKLVADKGNKQIHLYGMPILKDSEQFNLDHMYHLKVKVPNSRWVDKEQEIVKNFNLKFYDRYGSLAEVEAYEGYDNFLFIARNLAMHGENIFRDMDSDHNYIQTTYHIKPLKLEDSRNEFDYYENMHLHILEFNGKSFEKIE
jgi:hypothetical protein